MILAIDVGIKNLSLCLMDSKYEIRLWDTYNIIEDESDLNITCPSLKKNKSPCGKKCNFKYGTDNYTCKAHAPKDVVVSPISIKKIKDYSMQEIATLIIEKIEEVYNDNTELFDSIEKIRIELQPKFNPKMIFVSHVIYSKFIDILRNNEDIDIKFVRATQKLKIFKEECKDIVCNLKGEYAKRKWLSIEYARWFLKNKIPEDVKWVDHFEKHSKKDDLSDTLCYCYAEYQIKSKIKKT